MVTAASLAERVRAIRKERGLTQAQLADKAEMERTDINKLERGKLSLGPERLARVAAALEVSVLELQPEAEPDPPGLLLLGRQAKLEAEVFRLAADLRRLAHRVHALERRSPPGSPAEGTGR